RQRRRQAAAKRMQGERRLREARFDRGGFLLERRLLREQIEAPLLDVVLLRGGLLEQRVQLHDLAIEQRKLLLEHGLLRTPPGPQLVLLVLETGPLPGERVDFLYGVGRLLAVGCRYREQQQRANRHPSRCHYGSAHVLFFEALRRSDESMHGSVRCKRKAAGRKIPDPCGGAARRTNRGVMVRSRFADDLRYRRETSQMPLHRMRSLLAAALAIVTLAASSSVLQIGRASCREGLWSWGCAGR